MKRKLLQTGILMLFLALCIGMGARAGTPEMPCPFCGDRDFGYAWRPYDADPAVHRLHCVACDLPYADPASGAYTTQAHSGGTATCTQQAVCSVCGKAYGGLAAHTEAIDPGTAATCTATGLTQGSHCAVCGAPLIARHNIPANGHRLVPIPAVRATCTTLGSRAGSRCTVCNETFPGAVMRYKAHWYGTWTSNGDGTHSTKCRNSGCDAGKTVDCQYLEEILDGHLMRVCTVCGYATIALDIDPDEGGPYTGAAPGVMNAGPGMIDTGKKLQAAVPGSGPGLDFGKDDPPLNEIGLYAGSENHKGATFQPIQGAAVLALDRKTQVLGEVVALGMNDPLCGKAINIPGQPEQKALVLTAMTVAAEVAGSTNHSGIRVRINVTNGSTIASQISALYDAFFHTVSESQSQRDQAAEIPTVPVIGQAAEVPSTTEKSGSQKNPTAADNSQPETNPATNESSQSGESSLVLDVGQLVSILRASEGGQWLLLPSKFENGTLSFETVLPGLFMVIVPVPIGTQEQSLQQIPVREPIELFPQGPDFVPIELFPRDPDFVPINPLPQDQSGPQGLPESQGLLGPQGLPEPQGPPTSTGGKGGADPVYPEGPDGP